MGLYNKVPFFVLSILYIKRNYNMIEKKRIQIRRDSEENWVNINPILLYGEIGYDLTNNNIKIGDGERPWNILPYITNEVDLSGYYTKDEINTILDELNTNLSNDYYTKEQVDEIIINNNINYYTKEQIFTKEETETEIQNAIDGIEFPEQQEVSNSTITIVQGDNNQSFNLNQPENQTIVLEDNNFNWFGNETIFESLPDEQKVNGIYYISDKINYKEDITGQPYIIYKTSQLLNDKPFATTSDLPKEWFGTQEEFDSLETYETNTTYYIETSGEGGGSDIDLSNYYTKEQTYSNEQVYTKEETTTEIQTAINSIEIPTTDLSNYYTKEQTNTEIQTAIDSIDFPTTDLSNYYSKEETYSKTEIDNIVGLINNELETIING